MTSRKSRCGCVDTELHKDICGGDKSLKLVPAHCVGIKGPRDPSKGDWPRYTILDLVFQHCRTLQKL
jgi:hypothetical protein